MKSGAEYEKFTYEKLQRLFPDAIVKLNDKIVGRQSGLNREIDVSVRFSADTTDFLYIVQCKDWASRVDINTLGAFSAVMLDVGAAKGFLLCTSGFHKSNHQYALARGIELVSIQDIDSDKWAIEIQIPLVYVRNINEFKISFQVVGTQELEDLNRDRELTVELTGATRLRLVGTGLTPSIEEYIVQRAKDPTSGAKHGITFDVSQPPIEILFAGIWVPCPHLSVTLYAKQIHYLKYLTPLQYSQLRDHVRDTVLPLHVELEGDFRFDDTYVEMPEGTFNGFPGLWLQIEESSVLPQIVNTDTAINRLRPA